jgi:hypothetical protein
VGGQTGAVLEKTREVANAQANHAGQVVQRRLAIQVFVNVVVNGAQLIPGQPAAGLEIGCPGGGKASQAVNGQDVTAHMVEKR